MCHLLLRLTAAFFFLRLRLLMVTGEMTLCLMRLFELIVIDRFWNYEKVCGLTRAVRGTKMMSWHVACQWMSMVSGVGLIVLWPNCIILLFANIRTQ